MTGQADDLNTLLETLGRKAVNAGALLHLAVMQDTSSTALLWSIWWDGDRVAMQADLAEAIRTALRGVERKQHAR